MTSAPATPGHALEEPAFAALVERHRRELHVHCYRLLGSLQEAEDLVQETFLRAWRGRAAFEGRSSLRAWLYRIATNACLDALRSRPRRLVPADVSAPADPAVAAAPPAELPWLEPYPDRLLDAAEPGEVVAARETIELAFLAAIQHLPPRQRAALVLRDALGWSARETAELLATSVPSANSLLQRARATLRRQLPARHADWRPPEPDASERSLLRRYADAWERADVAALVSLLREDARLTMPPQPSWYEGRAAIDEFFRRVVFAPEGPGHRHRLLPTRANRQPAFAVYEPTPDGSELRPFALKVLRIEEGAIAEISGFVLPGLFPAFGLPPTLAP